MLFDKIGTYFATAAFVAAAVVAGLAITEAGLQGFGYSFFGWAYSAGRFLDLSAVLLLFAIADRLRQIRESLHAE